MRGDLVELVVAADDGSRTYEIVATRAGRRVEITSVAWVVLASAIAAGIAVAGGPPVAAMARDR